VIIFKSIIEGVKNIKNIPGRVYVRYTLFQIPGLALAAVLLWWLMRHFSISTGYFFVLLGLWLLKDIVIFPFVWHSYYNASGNVLEKMIGKTGTAVNDIDPLGYVRIGGEMWKAEILPGNRAVAKGEPVVVTGIDGLLLTVEFYDI
jgi:membrane-bound ClpP family serine protease